MSEIGIYRALFLPVYCSPSSFILTFNQSHFHPVTSTACACYCLFLVWCSTIKTPLLVSSSLWKTLLSSPELHFTSPTLWYAIPFLTNTMEAVVWWKALGSITYHRGRYKTFTATGTTQEYPGFNWVLQRNHQLIPRLQDSRLIHTITTSSQVFHQ